MRVWGGGVAMSLWCLCDTLLLQFWNKVDVFNLLMFLLAGWFQYQVRGRGGRCSRGRVMCDV